MYAAMSKKKPLNARMLNPQGISSGKDFVVPEPATSGMKAYPWTVSVRAMQGGYYLMRRIGSLRPGNGRYQYLLRSDGSRHVVPSEGEAERLAAWLNARD